MVFNSCLDLLYLLILELALLIFLFNSSIIFNIVKPSSTFGISIFEPKFEL
jgi:hypothetical protein